MVSIHTALSHARAGLATISQTPRLDAEALLAHVLNCDRSYLYAHPEAALSKVQNEQYRALVQRRASAEPLAYIVGVKEFWSLLLRVTPEVLIPRPETELLVELALARIPPHETWTIADLGTGSGAIALAIASERPRCRIIATDISQAALEVAAANADRLRLSNVRFVAGDWFSPLRGCFHMIVSNPPYVAPNGAHLHHPELRLEPGQALISSMGGLDALRLIAQGAGAFLHGGGWLIVEHGFEQHAAVRELFRCSGFQAIESYRDLARHHRNTIGRWP